MFSGLVLTSISTVVMRAALFQRKARSGWLEELDGIRQDASVSPDGVVGEVSDADADDIWTDLRAGGEYSDPHEISSLYANDDTPDLPLPKPKASKPAKAKPARPKARPSTLVAHAESPEPNDLPLPPAPLPPPPAQQLPPPPAPQQLPPPPQVSEPAVAEVATPDPVGTDVGGPFETEPMWVQPAPHPIRPSEMWHPADLVPPSLGEQTVEDVVDDRLVASDRSAFIASEAEVFGGMASEPAASTASAPIDPRRATELETELVVAADMALIEEPYVLPIEPAASGEGGLVAGPVGRRVRRDRPAGRPDSLPSAPGYEDRSPLPEQLLPPAAPPRRPAVTPSPAAPEAPAPAVAVADEVDAEAAELAATIEAVVATPAVDTPAVEPQVVETPAVETAAAPAERPAATAVTIVPAADGVLEVPGTIVRLGGSRQAAAVSDPNGLTVELAEGWVWVAPGEGSPTQIHIDLPQARIEVDPGASVLAVVEPDGSAFVVIADGAVELHRDGDGAPLARGAIAMLDAQGVAQVDQATDAEIESDPIVAENLALDAEL